MSVEISGIKRVLQNVKKKVEKIKPKKLSVGFFENAPYLNGTSVVEVAIYNEYGDPKKNKPPRPFMAMTKAKYQSQWREMFTQLLAKHNGDSEKALHDLGKQIVAEVQKTIATGQFAPNSPATIAAKGKDTPLRDSMHMLNNVTYDVK